MLKNRRIVFLALAIAIVGVVSLAYFLSLPKLPSFCSSLLSSDPQVSEAGYSAVCGISQASDGRLSIAVHNYHFDQAKNIQFHFSSNQQPPLPDEVFLLVNVSVTNIGGGNASIGGGWFSWIFNGSAPVASTMFIANASFTATYPNQTIPDINGGLYLPPGSKTDFWIFFYVRFQPVASSDLAAASGFKVEFVTFNENSYGGNYLGQGAYDCKETACQRPDVELIIGLLI